MEIISLSVVMLGKKITWISGVHFLKNRDSKYEEQ